MDEVEKLKTSIKNLEAQVKYLEDSLTAIVTGDVPEKADLNQLLLAFRGRGYLQYLEEKERKDARKI